MSYIKFTPSQLEIVRRVFPDLRKYEGYVFDFISIFMTDSESERLKFEDDDEIDPHISYKGSISELETDLKTSPFYSHYYLKRNGYQLFCLENREELENTYPYFNPQQFTELFETKWKMLEEDKKQKYNSRALEIDDRTFLLTYIKMFQEFIFRESIFEEEEKSKYRIRKIYNNAENEPTERLLYIIYDMENRTCESRLWEILGE